MAEPDIKRPRRVQGPRRPKRTLAPGASIWDQMAQANMPRTLPFTSPATDPRAQVAGQQSQLRQAASNQSGNRSAMQTAFNAATNGPTATGGGTGGGSAAGPGGGESWQGFAGRYLPGERDLLFSNPRIIVDDWLAQGPYKNNPQMAGDLGRYADIVFGNQNVGGLFELLSRGDISADANVGDDDQINYLVNLLKQQSTVGGKSPTVRQMLQALYEGFGDEDSSMGGLLTDGNGNPVPTQAAIGALMQFIPLLGEFTGNIRYSNAMRRQANRLAQDYMGMQAKGKAKGTFLDYLQQNFLT